VEGGRLAGGDTSGKNAKTTNIRDLLVVTITPHLPSSIYTFLNTPLGTWSVREQCAFRVSYTSLTAR
jgi:hypothetical protein